MFKNYQSILAGLFMASFLIIIATSGYCANNELTSVNDVDSIDVSAYKKNTSTLYVSFLYKNHKTDQLVFWRGYRTQASCDVYELIGNVFDKQKGRFIGEIKNHDLNDFNQGLYIEVATTGEKWGIVECGWTFGGIKFYGERTFLQHE